ESHDLMPYEALLQGSNAGNISAVMLGNMIIPGLTGGEPASISPAAVKLVRDMGYNGLVTTDALSAIGYDGMSLSQNVARAVEAGVDAPLFSYSSEQAILRAIHNISRNVSSSQINASYAKVAALKQNAP
ncbi:MAG TPA: glycoside hydrolase family 3 N-terminal domain-containing protein, partial [Candidatus Saccharimonadales bacterium]|nr:glycoside hydrolase family 3 N-terminal domain-containing protein [Candidatus Saccharimonadales bacterium]